MQFWKVSHDSMQLQELHDAFYGGELKQMKGTHPDRFLIIRGIIQSIETLPSFFH